MVFLGFSLVLLGFLGLGGFVGLPALSPGPGLASWAVSWVPLGGSWARLRVCVFARPPACASSRLRVRVSARSRSFTFACARASALPLPCALRVRVSPCLIVYLSARSFASLRAHACASARGQVGASACLRVCTYARVCTFARLRDCKSARLRLRFCEVRSARLYHPASLCARMSLCVFARLRISAPARLCIRVSALLCVCAFMHLRDGLSATPPDPRRRIVTPRGRVPQRSDWPGALP